MTSARGQVSAMPPDEMFHLFADMSSGDIDELRGAYLDGLLSVVARRQREERPLTGGQRAMAAARLVALYKWKNEARARARVRWMAKARGDFYAGQRGPCVVCGAYESLTEAHHIFPLAEQYAAGVVKPIQDHLWLCPTHHRAAHVMVSRLMANRQYSFPGMPAHEVDALDRVVGARFVELWSTAIGARAAA